MDALQHPHRFTRPPMPDPQQQQQRPPQGPPPPWYPQFQYQSPAPPQWAPPISDHHHQHHLLNYQQQQPNPTLQPPLPPYPVHHPHHYPHSPLPPPHMPPPPPYPLPNQTWGNQNWPRQQGWDYPDRNIPNTNEEDWAARAKAWAAAKAAVENQQTQSQFTPVGRMEEHSHAYHDQYQQAADPLLTEAHKSSLLPSVHQQFSFSVTTSHRPQVDHLQDSASFVSGRASFYVPDGSVSYDARDGAFSADSNPFAPPQENVLTNSSIYQQEVPSSYSSIPGTMEAGNQNEQFHKALVSSISSHQEQLNPQTTLPAVGSSASVEQPHFMHWDQSVEAINDPNDRASIFDHVSPHDYDSHQKASYMYANPAGHSGDVDRIAAVSVHAWTPAVVAGGVFSPIPPVPSGPQFDPTFVSHSSAPGQPAPVFGGIPRPGFRPTIPSAGASFGLGAGTALHPTTAFPGDSNGVFNVSERPKKASVPNWLREEIIKKKVAIASSSIQGHTADDSFHLSGTEANDKSFKEGDETDSRSVDSTHSAEGEEDYDDDVEVARLAAINLEIKHILTEVLLKVTDELFDEIATKVLSEDDMTVEVDNGTDSARHKISPPRAVPTPKASAKVLVPVIVKNVKVNDATEKSNSSSPGDVLGLGNYASEEEEVQSSSMRSARQINGDAHWRPSNDRASEEVLMEEKGTKLAEVEEQEETLQNSPLKYIGEGCPRKKGIHADNELVYDDGTAAATRAMPRGSEDQFIVKDSKMVEVSLKQTYDFESKDNVDGKFYMKHESECGNAVDLKSTTDEFQVRDDLSKSKNNDGNEGKRSSVSKVIVKEADDAVKVKAKQKHSDSGEPRRGKDRNVGKEQTDERNNGLKERIKDHDVKPEEKVRESDSRKSSKHSNTVKEDRKDTEKSRRVSAKEEDNRKRERTRDEKEDRSRHRDARDSRRYKRQHSPSVSRGKNVGDNSLADNISDSSDETSDNSRQRKLRSNKRSLSPLPVRSPRRQVSRSHSKHSQRRHSPYSSQETRRRRSRSGTPVRRRR